MLITLVGKKSLYKIVLPKIPVGSYWISDTKEETEKKLINIVGTGTNWQIVSNDYIKLVNIKYVNISQRTISTNNFNQEDLYMKKATLEGYGMYCVTIGNSSDIYIIYCEPAYDNSFEKFRIKSNSPIFVGKGRENQIIYNNVLTNNKHAMLFWKNGAWNIQNLDQKFGTFVNDEALINSKKLENGDIIFLMGLKIIIIGNNLFINNPLNKMQYNINSLELNKSREVLIKNDNEGKQNVEVYSKSDYFSRAPRITGRIEKEVVKIDAPPAAEKKEETPLLLILGSELTMGIMMLVSLSSTIQSAMNKTATVGGTIGAFLIVAAMLTSMIIFPMLSRKYEEKRRKKYEQERQQKYREYINSKINTIDKIMNKQRGILDRNYIQASECENIVLTKNIRLWERKIEDYDFLTVRLGTGEIPLQIDVQYPEERFSMDSDNLVDMVNEVGKKSKSLKNAPITISLTEKNIVGIISQDEEQQRSYLQNLILQLIAMQSYEDLKIVCLLKPDRKKEWEDLKIIPHIWGDTKQIRFFADNYIDMKEISTYLEEEMRERRKYVDASYKAFKPYYLIITDDYNGIENLKIINEVLESKNNLGFGLLCTARDLTQLPDECKEFIVLENQVGKVLESEMSAMNQSQFIIEQPVKYDFNRMGKKLLNIPIRYNISDGKMLPNTYTFLEMYDVGKIDQLNVMERWNKNDTTLSLQAPIGVDPAGMPITLDIHEKFHGPHGLIAGSTGSGKSELIITYILSLAINYHPDDVNFMLIDYKGGGLAGAFKKKSVKLPHLVGTITNIDTVGLQRSLDSIQSELRRRQILFNEVRNKIDESTIDIYKYQKLYHEGRVKEPVPHLLIICDEFAELKQQQQDFMDELISVARIGRSLGVHLILATQKPAGIVDEQIRSNSRFGICLKVQDKEDSNDVIKRPDAAGLKTTGQFFMQVGNDEYFTLGQSAWSGAPYIPANETKKKVDTSIEFISNTGTTIKRVDDYVEEIKESQGDQLTNIVKYLYDLAESNKIQTNQLWLENIPETIYIDETRNKYNVEEEENTINPVIGEYDDPYNQRQGIVRLNLSKDGNTIIYGNAESGKETLLSSIIYDIINNYDTEQAQMYIIDFGSEALKVFKKSPHVGDVILATDDEKMSRFFEMMKKELKKRKNILSEYGGDYKLYLATSGEKMSLITIILNNYEGFSESYLDKNEDIFQQLTREGTKCGIVFIMTANASNDIRYRLAQNFKQIIALQLNNDDDYYNIFDSIGKKRPSHIFGRGLVKIEGNLYEFQTARICEPENWNTYINEVLEVDKNNSRVIAKRIPVMPETITLEDLQTELQGIDKIPLGIEKDSLEVYIHNFKKQLINIIVAKNLEDAVNFSYGIITEINYLEDINLIVLDSENFMKSSDENEYEKFKANLSNKEKYNICVLIGIDKLLNNNSQWEAEFDDILKKADKTKNCSFIIIESATKLKNHDYDEWHKNYVDKDSGIWIGNGVNDQYLITISNRNLANNCGSNYGYVVKNGDAKMLKILGTQEGE